MKKSSGIKIKPGTQKGSKPKPTKSTPKPSKMMPKTPKKK